MVEVKNNHYFLVYVIELGIKNQGFADKTTSLALIIRKNAIYIIFFQKSVDCRIISDKKNETKLINDSILECKYCQILKQKCLKSKNFLAHFLVFDNYILVNQILTCMVFFQ